MLNHPQVGKCFSMNLFNINYCHSLTGPPSTASPCTSKGLTVPIVTSVLLFSMTSPSCSHSLAPIPPVTTVAGSMMSSVVSAAVTPKAPPLVLSLALQPIPGKLVDKIKKGENLELKELLPDKFEHTAAHIPGKLNVAADALSRNEVNTFFSLSPQISYPSASIIPSTLRILLGRRHENRRTFFAEKYMFYHPVSVHHCGWVGLAVRCTQSTMGLKVAY